MDRGRTVLMLGWSQGWGRGKHCHGVEAVGLR